MSRIICGCKEVSLEGQCCRKGQARQISKWPELRRYYLGMDIIGIQNSYVSSLVHWSYELVMDKCIIQHQACFGLLLEPSV